MPPKTYRLFISYRTTDSAQVDRIAQNLRLLKHADGTPRYIPWQDKRDLMAGVPNWWDAILDAIESCDVFVFHLTLDSLKSEVCRAELDYAYRLNLPIIVVVLETAYDLIPASGSYRLHDEAKALLPTWLGKIQQLYYTGAAEFFTRFQTAIEYYEQQWPPRTTADRPLHPYSDQTHSSAFDLYDEACERAYKLDFKASEDLFRELVRRNLVDFADIARQWIELLQRYQELIAIDSKPHLRFKFQEKWDTYLKLFPKGFLVDIDKIFDPKGLAKNDSPPPTHVKPPIPPSPKAKDKPSSPPNTTTRRDWRKPSSEALLPAPFAWIGIQGKGHSFAKYPITNAQYAMFIHAKGYHERDYWTPQGWQLRQSEHWTEPRFWQNSTWNKPDHPVVGVSWYEALAFCAWLKHETGELITLPTQIQWQYAAQGHDQRVYPWGPAWDCNRCNNSVAPCNSESTQPVQHYEGKGDSPFGVVDMAGNVWEWSLTDYETKANDPMLEANLRVICGGAWGEHTSSYFHCDFCGQSHPAERHASSGFRIVRN
ncbi:MAG: SUMF1/EgtB/PvdO family nonheme iron enzyme [Anaerolineae bacterium]|jgi:hypothetical protein|nr:SUMF1/EgtB/PvdO family nonheme iron enzyme [Anaerolineae bacterium]